MTTILYLPALKPFVLSIERTSTYGKVTVKNISLHLMRSKKLMKSLEDRVWYPVAEDALQRGEHLYKL